jgi:hypothetical protein
LAYRHFLTLWVIRGETVDGGFTAISPVWPGDLEEATVVSLAVRALTTRYSLADTAKAYLSHRWVVGRAFVHQFSWKKVRKKI